MAARNDRDRAMYVISIAAELAGVHPQTLRFYERKGLVQPERTQGNTRRYSASDIARLRKIQELTQEGVNLAGVMRILELEERLARMERRYESAVAEAERIREEALEAFSARDRTALVPVRDVRRVRRVLKADLVEQAGRRRTFAVPPAQGDNDD